MNNRIAGIYILQCCTKEHYENSVYKLGLATQEDGLSKVRRWDDRL